MHADHQYLENCLSHLIANGISYALIDNGIDDEGRAVLAKPFIRRHLIRYVTVPYAGEVELNRLLETKEELFDTIKMDWGIHLDVDEIMHSYVESETLSEAIARVDAAGWTVIDFNEFVFLPVVREYEIGLAGCQPLRHYYFFEPRRPRSMRARKSGVGLSALPRDGGPGSGGHLLYGPGVAIAPETFATRHYIVRNQEHAFNKYVNRRYAESGIRRGWHSNRIGFDRAAFRLPGPGQLLELGHPESRLLDRSQPKAAHFWRWDPAQK